MDVHEKFCYHQNIMVQTWGSQQVLKVGLIDAAFSNVLQNSNQQRKMVKEEMAPSYFLPCVNELENAAQSNVAIMYT